MPLRKVGKKAPKKAKKAALKANFHDLRHGKTFARTLKKFGRAKARSQMQAIALQTSGYAKKRATKKRK